MINRRKNTQSNAFFLQSRSTENYSGNEAGRKNHRMKEEHRKKFSCKINVSFFYALGFTIASFLRFL